MLRCVALRCVASANSFCCKPAAAERGYNTSILAFACVQDCVALRCGVWCVRAVHIPSTQQVSAGPARSQGDCTNTFTWTCRLQPLNQGWVPGRTRRDTPPSHITCSARITHQSSELRTATVCGQPEWSSCGAKHRAPRSVTQRRSPPETKIPAGHCAPGMHTLLRDWGGVLPRMSSPAPSFGPAHSPPPAPEPEPERCACACA